ncbi:hypothetical protein L3X38_027185 [Prunus dulcis]|uniref:Uncharacterized protein n=1 Tax=Prunus dulcis TaxID=3755 RepID=A0AAD4Z068_PRUDU|nr:hypothetical protein L3X38_027185 [Prunus dulcis]
MYNEIPVTEPIEKIFDSFWNLHRTEGREIRDVKAEREQNRVTMILSYICKKPSVVLAVYCIWCEKNNQRPIQTPPPLRVSFRGKLKVSGSHLRFASVAPHL